MYFALKHLHFALLGLTALLLCLRHVWQTQGSETALPRAVLASKLLGALYGLVTLSGVGLCAVLGLNPLNNAVPWLSDKFAAILIFVFLVVMANRARHVLIRHACLLGALGWLYAIAKLALTKHAVIFA
ncbi:MAG: SirB2 family protein [Aeromonas sp.]